MPESAAAVSICEHTAGDGYRWRYRHYPPTGESRARIVCVHGIQSHGGWYQGSCERLAQVGFEVYFLDRRGSGLNEIDRGESPQCHLVFALFKVLTHAPASLPSVPIH